jgi:hypothetical protein
MLKVFVNSVQLLPDSGEETISGKKESTGDKTGLPVEVVRGSGRG